MRICGVLVLLYIALHSVAQGGFRSKIYLPGGLNHTTKAIFEIPGGKYFASGFTIDTLNGIQVNRLTIMGLDADGKLQWVKKYGDNSFFYYGNLFIFRSFYKLGNNVYYAGCARDSTNKQIGVLIKFDLNGDTVWQKIYRDPDPLEDVIPQMLTGSVDGGFLITGFFQNWDIHYSRCLLIKTDANGNEMWRKKIGKIAPDVQDGKAIVQDTVSKKIAIVGYQYIGNYSNYDNILILDSTGNKLAQTKYNSVGGSLVDLIQTKDKKFITVGRSIFAETVGGTNLTGSFIAKFDIDTPMTPIWKIDNFDIKALTNGFSGLIEFPNEDILVGGYLDSASMNNMYANYLTKFVMFDKNGNIKWKKYYDYKTNNENVRNDQILHAIERTKDGGWVAAIGCLNFPEVNPFFFVKYDSTGCDSTEAYCRSRDSLILLGLSGYHADYPVQFEVYPNPASDLVQIQVNAPEGEDMRLEVSDLTGRQAGSYNMHSTGDLQINTGKYQNGVYFITLYSGGNAIGVRKLLIRH
jgi:hypothetical protein